MTKLDVEWMQTECVCYLEKPYCDHSCYHDKRAWKEVEDYLMDDDTWSDEYEVFEPVKKRKTNAFQ